MDKSRSQKFKNSKAVVLSLSALSEMGAEYAASHTDNNLVSVPLPLLPRSCADNENIQIKSISSSDASIIRSSSYLSVNSEQSFSQNSLNTPSSVSSMQLTNSYSESSPAVSSDTSLGTPASKSVGYPPQCSLSSSTVQTPTTNAREDLSVSTLTPLPPPVTKSAFASAKSSAGPSGKSKGNSVSFSVPVPRSSSVPQIQFINDDETKAVPSNNEPPRSEGQPTLPVHPTPLLMLPTGAIHRTTVNPEFPHRMFENHQWKSPVDEVGTRSSIEGARTYSVPSSSPQYIVRANNEVVNGDKMPFIARTSDASNLWNNSNMAYNPNNSEQTMSPTTACLRKAEKQPHHGVEIPSKEDDVEVQEAIMASLQANHQHPKPESEASDNIAAIVNNYSDSHLSQDGEQIIDELTQCYSSEP